MSPSREGKLIFNPIANDLRASTASNANEYSYEFGSKKYYTICGFGGLLSCGLTHVLVTPLDLVKCRLQVIFKTFFIWMTSEHFTKQKILEG